MVRLHGYNQEIEVKQAELEVSLGQDAIDLQIEDAEEELVSWLSCFNKQGDSIFFSPDPDPTQGFDDQILKKKFGAAEEFIFFIKNYNLPIHRPP